MICARATVACLPCASLMAGEYFQMPCFRWRSTTLLREGAQRKSLPLGDYLARSRTFPHIIGWQKVDAEILFHLHLNASAGGYHAPIPFFIRIMGSV